MELALILLGVFVLYLRTWCGKNRHYYIIDDNVRRWGYLYVIPQTSPPPEFYATRPHPWRHFFLVLTHSLNVWVINLLFGWQVAALFAFSPISVNGTAWITGGYYGVTMFLSLVSYYFITTFPNLIGLGLGSMFFTAALGSTITCLGLPFVFLLSGQPLGLILFWPLGMYLFGKRFRAGFAIRNSGKRDKITWRKLAVMTKVMAYYIRINLFPDKLAFFRRFGQEYGKNEAVKKDLESFNLSFLMAFLVVGSFAFVGYQFSPLGTIWFLVTLAPFTQFKILGQFVAERYLYLPQLGIYMIIAGMIGDNPVLMAIVLTLYAYRTHLYIPAFRNIENLYKNGLANYPDCISNYANLGERYLHTKEIFKARRLLEDGLKLDPLSFLCHTNLAAYWISVKGWEKAMYHSGMAMSDPNNPLAKRILSKQYTELKVVVEKENIRKAKQLEEALKNVRDTNARVSEVTKTATLCDIPMPVLSLSK